MDLSSQYTTIRQGLENEAMKKSLLAAVEKHQKSSIAGIRLKGFLERLSANVPADKQSPSGSSEIIIVGAGRNFMSAYDDMRKHLGDYERFEGEYWHKIKDYFFKMYNAIKDVVEDRDRRKQATIQAAKQAGGG